MLLFPESYRQGARLFFLLSLPLLLAACARQAPPAPALPVTEPEPASVEAFVSQAALDEAERARRYVADILFEGMRALRTDRLMTPPENSAYHYFNRALALDPDNQIARDGMRDIAARYLELADLAGRQGQFDNAESFLRRAAQVDNNHPALASANRRLQSERQSTHSVTTLNSRDVINREASVVARLRELAQVVAETNAFVMITAVGCTCRFRVCWAICVCVVISK
jgi:tetratricopeptide (TPR) repeat protein